MLSQKLQDDLMTAYQKVYEEKRGHAAGSSDVEKQASQLASDVRYKAKGKVKPGASEEEKKKIFLQILNASPAPTAVKAMAKSKLLGEEVVQEMRFDDGKSGERLKALAKKRKIPMSKMKNHPQFKDDVKEGSSYGITRGSGKPSGQMAAFAKEEEDESDTQREKLEKKMKTKRVNKMIVKSAKSEKKLAKELMGEMKAPRMQKGAMAYDGPNKERSEAADRVIAKTKAKRAKMRKEEVEQIDELSNKTLGSYSIKAKQNIKSNEKTAKKAGYKEDEYKTFFPKRREGIKRSEKKMMEEVELGEMMRNKLTGLPTLKPEAKKPKEKPMTPDQRRQIPEGMDPVGKEDGDINNDGKKDSTDSYLMKRRKAIGKAIAKKRGRVKEGFSAWRIELDFNEQVKK